MTEAPATSAENILASVSNIYTQDIDAQRGTQPSEEMCDKDVAAIEEEPTRSPTPRRSSVRERISKKIVNPLMGDDLWNLGIAQLQKKKIVAVRDERWRRLKEKSSLQTCIVRHV